MASIKFANTYDVAGLDVNKIPKVKDAVKAYTAKLNKLVDELDADKSTEWNAIIKTAIKGEHSEKAAKSYMSSICEQCRHEIKRLNSFVNALDKLEQKYKSNDMKTPMVLYSTINMIDFVDVSSIAQSK